MTFTALVNFIMSYYFKETKNIGQEIIILSLKTFSEKR